jgi:hypothetical protein
LEEVVVVATVGVGIVFGLEADNAVSVVIVTTPVMSVDGWCNVVAGGGGCDDITMFGVSIFIGTTVDGEGIIVGDVAGIIIWTDVSTVASFAIVVVVLLLLFVGAGSM